jgi:hypothetical protein
MSDCNVCIGGDDYEPWDFYDQRIVKARKPHKCCECYREIAAGSEYECITGKCDGYIDRYKTCLDCMNIRRGLACGAVGLTMLWDEIAQVFDQFVSTACLTKIKTPSAKAYFLERWREHRGLVVTPANADRG